jgi:hypothetical protein
MSARRLGRKSNWSDSADLAMMFRGAYSSEFYRALADALHLRSARRASRPRRRRGSVCYRLERTLGLARTVA